MAGRFVVFEGPDGTGKTSITKAVEVKLADLLPQLEVIGTIHPGSTVAGQKIRELVKSSNYNLDPLTTQMLMASDYVAFKHQILIPALERNALILGDRCSMISGLIYGECTGINYTELNSLMNLMANPRIDRVYLLDCSEEQIKQRLASRNIPMDRLDQIDGIRDAYHSLFKREGAEERLVILNRAVAFDNIRFMDTSGKTIDDLATTIAMELAAEYN